MKLKNSLSQPDPHVSFLDVIFCLCVFLCVLLVIMMSAKEVHRAEVEVQKEVAESQEKVEVAEAEVQGEDVRTTRFRGRGGQPHLNITVAFGDGLIFEIAGHRLTWFEFRSIVCNLDRRESGSQPAFIFNMLNTESYRNATVDDVVLALSGRVSRREAEDAKEGSDNYIFNLYKKATMRFEQECRRFKKKYTTKHLGNWDGDEVGDRHSTNYAQRKSLGNPFLWFTVDEEEKVILLGPMSNPYRISPSVFVDIVAAIRGGDGFYIEYRDPNTLRYNPKGEIPDWVMREVIDPLGFSMVASGS